MRTSILTHFPLSNHINNRLPFTELHLVEYHTSKLEFLQAYEIRQKQTSLVGTKFKEFSGPWDPNGYNDKSITDDLITDIFIDFSERTRSGESQDYLKTLTGEQQSQSASEHELTFCRGACLSLDNTFKLAAKATVVDHVDGSHSKLMKGGILSVINESSEILAWVRTFKFLFLNMCSCMGTEILPERVPRRG